MTPSWSRHALAVAVASIALAGLVACSTDDSAGPAPFGGTGNGADATVGGPGDTDAASVGQALCGKYGGYAFVQTLSAHLGTTLAADCRIGAYFSPALDTTPHLSECLTKQLGTFFQCAGVTYDKDSKGASCRSMTEAHKGLALRRADFDAFLDDVIAQMRADGVSDTDIQSLVPTFIGLQGNVVQKTGAGNTKCGCPNKIYDGGSCDVPASDAGDAGDSSSDASRDTGAGDTGSAVDAADATPPSDAAGE